MHPDRHICGRTRAVNKDPGKEHGGSRVKKRIQKLIALTVIAAMSGFLLTGCGTSSDTDSQTSGSSSGITIFNSKMEIQDQMLEMAKRYEKETGVKVEV